ncbi:hypothetical protein K2173_020518 [Erythroxylum novogranatense]|uniref:Uncharacterized protein n=1 Tax=Erythroxylum novogranatense TaxID=1862640 RepID=A0AAV8TGL2_9ROSI|nr:hypothetical protein K2173_020518 [Erythroxylum novogranatense]
MAIRSRPCFMLLLWLLCTNFSTPSANKHRHFPLPELYARISSTSDNVGAPGPFTVPAPAPSYNGAPSSLYAPSSSYNGAPSSFHAPSSSYNGAPSSGHNDGAPSSIPSPAKPFSPSPLPPSSPPVVWAPPEGKSSSSSRTLNGGQKAGIVIGSMAGASLLLCGGMVYRKRRSNIRRERLASEARRPIF